MGAAPGAAPLPRQVPRHRGGAALLECKPLAFGGVRASQQGAAPPFRTHGAMRRRRLVSPDLAWR